MRNGVTVMLMNYGRPNLLRDQVLPKLCSYDLVSQVIISHGLAESSWLAAEFTHPKVLHTLDFAPGGLNEKLGVARRFKVAGDHATSPWVLIMDDDILPTEEALGELVGLFASNPNRIVGKWGRRRHLWPHVAYDTVDSFGDVDVVLTKCFMVKRAALSLFTGYADVLGIPAGLPSTVLWNGEDIFISLMHKFSSGYWNYAAPARLLSGVAEVSASDALDNPISGGVDKSILGIAFSIFNLQGGRKAWLHAVHRATLWGLAEHRFELLQRQLI